MTSDVRAMTHEELMAMPVTVDLETANRALGIGRTTGYGLAKRQQYPVRLLPHSRGYRVSRYDLLRHLGVSTDEDGTNAGAA
ncbi:integrase [Streptomyces acidiscabies]|uniref:integrase n=1 Tax=Streptomyces acidiscabies TaxID=42234 RepID=UPI00211624E0|nr:integrase [Streptomyces acidiscabies]